MMITVQCILETGKGPHLITEDVLQTYYLQTIRTVRQPELRSVTKQKDSIIKAVLLKRTLTD